jgi:mannan endo-1,4-beta-mannosidase
MRSILLLLFISLQAQAADFVKATPQGLTRHGAPYRFVGANLWYGMNLGSTAPGADRARLVRELDRLQALGVTNLRVLGASEGPDFEPWRIAPALQMLPGFFREDVFTGLDFLLAEMGKRGMTAVVCLGNMWPWSGGFGQYLIWSHASPSIPYPPPQPGGDWNVYQRFIQQFYSDEKALAAYRATVHQVLTRVNTITGQAYADDPTIMAWQLANEPRGVENAVAFNHWLDSASSYLKSIDANHLVTTGSEGETPWPSTTGNDFVANHSYPAIDYATAHIWAGNWGWYDPAHATDTYASAVAKMKDYFQDHLMKARRLGKPLVIEEFGLARDGGTYDPSAKTTMRDKYYGEVFDQITSAASAGAPVAGVNFWAWAGEGRPKKPFGSYWKAGDPWIGDPPHEAQGWYSVYDQDTTTAKVIQKYAKKLRQLK